jgi:hypothetical protein
MSEPIIPPNHGVTPEAMEALGIQDPEMIANLGIDSDDELNDEGLSPPFPSMADMAGEPLVSDGTVIDAELVDEPSSSIVKPAERARRERTKETPRAPRDAKTGPPSLDEWTGFFSRVVLKVATEYYISVAFRGIDEDALSEREIDRLAMTDDERQLIAVPFAEISNKSKFMRKHGRMIVASGDAFNAVVVFGMWASRVNRIASKYRPRQPKAQVRINNNGSSGPGTPQAGNTEGATGGRFPDGWFGHVGNPGSG